jgi:hypothetical protein
MKKVGGSPNERPAKFSQQNVQGMTATMRSPPVFHPVGSTGDRTVIVITFVLPSLATYATHPM